MYLEFYSLEFSLRFPMDKSTLILNVYVFATSASTASSAHLRKRGRSEVDVQENEFMQGPQRTSLASGCQKINETSECTKGRGKVGGTTSQARPRAAK